MTTAEYAELRAKVDAERNDLVLAVVNRAFSPEPHRRTRLRALAVAAR